MQSGYPEQMLLRLVQALIFFGVICVAIYYEWPGSGLAHGVVALLAVLFVTVLPVLLYDDARRLMSRWRERHRG